MTDTGLIAKKLVRIETCLRDLARIDPAAVERDIVHERFAEHTLQIAIQAAIDVASHIVADDRLGDAMTNHELFDLLARNGWLPDDLVGRGPSTERSMPLTLRGHGAGLTGPTV